ncbi:hypothetical protein AOLI_G00313570 [Acnodon oligacanthus]
MPVFRVTGTEINSTASLHQNQTDGRLLSEEPHHFIPGQTAVDAANAVLPHHEPVSSPWVALRECRLAQNSAL